MRNIIKFFITHPTIVNLCVLLIVGLGAFSLINTQTRFFPKVKERFVDIAVPYPRGDTRAGRGRYFAES